MPEVAVPRNPLSRNGSWGCPEHDEAPRSMSPRGLALTVGPPPGDPGAGATRAVPARPLRCLPRGARRASGWSADRSRRRLRWHPQPVRLPPPSCSAVLRSSRRPRRSGSSGCPGSSVRRGRREGSSSRLRSTSTRGFADELSCTGRCTESSTPVRAHHPRRTHPCGQHSWITPLVMKVPSPTRGDTHEGGSPASDARRGTFTTPGFGVRRTGSRARGERGGRRRGR